MNGEQRISEEHQSKPKKVFFLLLVTVYFFAGTNNAFANTITTWTSPSSGNTYLAGQPVTVSGTWQFSGFTPNIITYYLDGAGPTLCQEGNAGSSGSFSCTTPPLSAGTHSLYLLTAGVSGGSLYSETYINSARTITVGSSANTGNSQSSVSTPSTVSNTQVAGTGCGSAAGSPTDNVPISNLCVPDSSAMGSAYSSNSGTSWLWGCYTSIPSTNNCVAGVPCISTASSQGVSCSAPKITPTAPKMTSSPTGPVVNLTANPNPYTPNQPTTISWTSSGATSCTWVGGIFLGDTATLNGSRQANLSAGGASATLRCSGGGTLTDQYLKLVSTSDAAPSFNIFTANNVSNSLSVAPNTAVSLYWDVSRAISCMRSGDWSGEALVYGNTSYSAGAATANKSYTLTCSGNGAPAVSTINVNVTGSTQTTTQTTPAPTITSFSANSTSIANNTATTLSWASTNATSCTATGAWSGTKATSGTSVSTGNLTTTSTFTLTCTGAGGTTAAQSVTVTVAAAVVSCTTAANSCGVSASGTLSGGVCSASVPALPTNYGNICASSANSCSQTASGTIDCNGICSASTPALPINYGNVCASAANSCSQTNSGTIGCNGTCSASTPALPANYGNSCTSAANTCGTKSTGTIGCTGTCSASTPALPTNYGDPCTSAANACNQTSTGTIGCNGSCSAVKPLDSACPVVTTTCTTAANSCGASATGTLVNGVCSASVPANPATYGDPCTSAANACNQTSTGTIGCNGSCSAVKPLDSACPVVAVTNTCISPANACGATNTGTLAGGVCSVTTPTLPTSYGAACTSVANACSQSATGTIGCDGTCNASTPANPTNYGNACTSAANSCGQTSTGTIGCNGSCSATKPADPVNNVCTTLPAPTVTLTSADTSVPSGGTTTLNWASTNATSCTASGAWSGNLAVSGTATTPSITSAATFTVTCSGSGGSDSKSVSITVGAAPLSSVVSVIAATAPVARVLSVGMVGADVKKLQQFLITTHYLPAGNAIGVFGPLTAQAVKSFQQANGLGAVTTAGVVNNATLLKIQTLGGTITATAAENAAVQQSISGKAPAATATNSSTGLSCATAKGPIAQNIVYGQSGASVFTLQCKLISLRYLAAGGAVGRFGPMTLKAVKDFQCNTSILCSGSGYGKVGPKTAQALNNIR